MLKITKIGSEPGTETWGLEGKLLSAWLDEVESVCLRPHREPRRICLDLSGLTYADSLGADYLVGLLRQGVIITGPNPFISELLKRAQS